MPRWVENRIGKTIHFVRRSYLDWSCGILTGTTAPRQSILATTECDRRALLTSLTRLTFFSVLGASWWSMALALATEQCMSRRGPGRPHVMKTIVDLVLQMALENPSWGYTRIQGAMANLGHEVGRGTIANILREYGIDPAPERDKRMPWSTFLRAHRECLVATDFLTVEVCTIKGLVTHYILFFIDIASRAVKDRGYHSSSRQPVDDTDRAESHRPERRLPSRQALFDS